MVSLTLFHSIFNRYLMWLVVNTPLGLQKGLVILGLRFGFGLRVHLYVFTPIEVYE